MEQLRNKTACNVGALSLIPGLRRTSGGGNGNSHSKILACRTGPWNGLNQEKEGRRDDEAEGKEMAFQLLEHIISKYLV